MFIFTSVQLLHQLFFRHNSQFLLQAPKMVEFAFVSLSSVCFFPLLEQNKLFREASYKLRQGRGSAFTLLLVYFSFVFKAVSIFSPV